MHRHHPKYHPHYPRSNRPSRGTGWRAVAILVAVGLAGMAMTVVTPTRKVVAPPRPEPMARMSAEHLQEYATANAVVAVAAAGRDDLRSRPGYTEGVMADLDDPTLPRGAIRLDRVRSESPHLTRERALNDALLVARQQLADRLAAEKPPVTAVPALWEIRDQYVRQDSIAEVHPTREIRDEWAAANLDADRVWVELDVEVSPDQMRQLRADQRRMYAGLWFGLAFVAAVAGYGFLRLDAMTKGYLTTVLGVAAGGLVAAAVAALAMLG